MSHVNRELNRTACRGAAAGCFIYKRQRDYLNFTAVP